jgi:tripartite ATP-independent transporter DctM subunit
VTVQAITALAGGEDLPASAPGRSEAWAPRKLADQLCLALVAVAFVAELLIVLVNVFIRQFFGDSITWQTEVTQVVLETMSFVGGALAYSRGYQVAITRPVELLDERWGARVKELVDIFIIVSSAVMLIVGLPLFRNYTHLDTPVLGFSEALVFAPFMLGMVLFCFYGVCKLVDRWDGPATLFSCAGFVAVGAVLVFLHWYFLAPIISDHMMPIIVVICFLALVALGVPIGFVLLGTSYLMIWLTEVATVSVVPQEMGDATNKFLFVAVPFFVFAGLMMASSGVSDRIAAFLQGILGRSPGGFFQVIIISMYLFSGISGSKLADTVAVGSPMRQMLDKHGYSRAEGAAVLTAAAVMGETVPPSLALLILGSVTTLSVGTLLIAGLVPAAVLAVCLMVMVYLKCRRTGAGTGPERESWSAVGVQFLQSVPGLVLPVILVGGIAFGVATPTEVSSFAVVYGVILAFAYRVGWKDFRAIFEQSVETAGMVLFLLTSAAAFSFVLAYAQVPQDVANFVSNHLHHSWMFLLASIVVLVIFGCALEGAAAIIIMAPVLLPVATDLGIDPLKYGLLLIISMGIGTHLPPVGMGIYVAASTMKVPVERVFRPLFGYLAILMIGVLLIAFVDPLTTWLPHVLGHPG